jgi:hypothetical protein
MRHSDINLTMSRYTHIFRGQESEAVAKLPNLGVPRKAIATGTDGKNDLALNLAPETGKQYLSMDSNRHTTPIDGVEKGV